MLTLGGRDPSNGAGLSFGMLGVLVNEMNFGSIRSRDIRAAKGQF
jgi:hypothetical protein